MKKYISILTIILMVIASSSSVGFAQSNRSNKVSVDVSKLSPAAQEEIDKLNQKQNIQENLKTASSWAGMGKEIGTAVRDGLMAVVEASDKFGKTEVGYFTMLMIGVSILGSKLLGLFIWVTYVSIALYLTRYLTKRRRVIKSKTGNIFSSDRKIEYEYQDPILDSDLNGYLWAIGIVFLIVSGICAALIH